MLEGRILEIKRSVFLEVKICRLSAGPNPSLFFSISYYFHCLLIRVISYLCCLVPLVAICDGVNTTYIVEILFGSEKDPVVFILHVEGVFHVKIFCLCALFLYCVIVLICSSNSIKREYCFGINFK